MNEIIQQTIWPGLASCHPQAQLVGALHSPPSRNLRDFRVAPTVKPVSFFKRLVWNAASSIAMGELFTWKLSETQLLIERRTMPLAGLGEGFCGATVAHISDLHCSPIVLDKYLLHIFEMINSFEVDFVVVTGDFITGLRKYARQVAKLLKSLKPKIATLGVLGNHDYGRWHPTRFGRMFGLGNYMHKQLTDAGLTMLMNEAAAFRRNGAIVQFAGTEDLWSENYDVEAAFRYTDPRHPIIGLVHNPDAAEDFAEMGAQWTLAGHTHGKNTPNTVIHRTFFPTRYPRRAAGYYPLTRDAHVYVNRGLGHSVRIYADHRPEITLFTLENA